MATANIAEAMNGGTQMAKGNKNPVGYKNSPVIGDNGANVAPGNNTRYAAFLLEISSWPAPDKSDVTVLESRFRDYLKLCTEYDMKIGNQAAYMAIGISKDDVYNWEHERCGSVQHRDFIKKVKQICASYREGLMQDGQINPVTGIFWQKNYDGLRDAQELVVTPNGQRLSDSDYQDIADRYKQLPTISEDE